MYKERTYMKQIIKLKTNSLISLPPICIYDRSEFQL